MALDDRLSDEEITYLAAQIDSVPQELQEFVTQNFTGDKSLDFYKGFIRCLISAGPVGSLGRTEQHRRPLMETAICIAYELVERGMIGE